MKRSKKRTKVSQSNTKELQAQLDAMSMYKTYALVKPGWSRPTLVELISYGHVDGHCLVKSCATGRTYVFPDHQLMSIDRGVG